MVSVFGTSLSTGRVDLTSFAKKTDLTAALNAIASNITRVHDEQKNKHANLQKAYVDLQKKVSTLKEKVERDDQRVRGETGPKGEKAEKERRAKEAKEEKALLVGCLGANIPLKMTFIPICGLT